LVLQTTGNLALTATANSAFAVIVAVTKLPISSDDNTKNDFGIYMPTPLFFTEIIFDCYNVNDYHVSMLYDMKELLITTVNSDNLLCNSKFTVFDEMGNDKCYPLIDSYNEVKFEEYNLNVGINSRFISKKIID
uniref:LRR containing protein n=1 Tax=Brugia timori TaxID=42155 RepID=A0A0R3QFJ4_9BILA